jgi:hypothetical protein
VVSGDDFTLLTGNLGKQSNAAAAVLPLSTPSVVAVTLSPSTVQPLSGVSTVLTQNNATSSNTVLTDQKQDQKSSAPSAALNRNDNRNHVKFGSTHHPRA